MNKKNKKPVLIEIIEFSERISVSYNKALQLSKSKEFCDKHISVRIDPNSKKGGVRIHWERYLNFVDTLSVVEESKRVS